MLKGYRIKHLFLEMSFDTLEKECKREKWIIPTVTDLKGLDIKHECVWTNSIVWNDQYKLTEDDIANGVKLGICYNAKTDKEFVVNKKVKMNCVVLVKE